MANKIWKEVFLIMCSSSRKNARNTERFSLSLRITDDYALATLCCSPHNVCNEDGKLDGLPLNRALRDSDGDIYDIVAGNFFIVGLGQNDFTDLPHELAEQFAERFRQPELFLREGDKIAAAPMPDEQVQGGMSY